MDGLASPWPGTCLLVFLSEACVNDRVVIDVLVEIRGARNRKVHKCPPPNNPQTCTLTELSTDGQQDYLKTEITIAA